VKLGMTSTPPRALPPAGRLAPPSSFFPCAAGTAAAGGTRWINAIGKERGRR